MRKNLTIRSPWGELIGTTVVRVDDDERALEVEYQAKHEFTNRIGTISGGMLSAMLDSVTGLAALAILPDDLFAAHTSLQVEYLRPAKPGKLIARAKVLEHKNRDIRARGELVDLEGRIVARGEATLRVLRKRRG
jgi:uncharacterized protein (TIGR00369 family)